MLSPAVWVAFVIRVGAFVASDYVFTDLIPVQIYGSKELPTVFHEKVKFMVCMLVLAWTNIHFSAWIDSILLAKKQKTS